MAKLRLHNFRRCFNLREKIAGGYLSLLIISIGGVLCGYVLGDYFQYQSVKTAEAIGASLNLLNHLQIELLKTHGYRYRLASLNEAESQVILSDFIRHQENLEATWFTLQEQTETTSAENTINNPALASTNSFLTQYTASFEAYFDELDQLATNLQRLEIEKEGGDDVDRAQLSPFRPGVGISESEIDTLSEALRDLIEEIRMFSIAANESIEKTDLLRFQISSGFILVSLTISLFLISKLSEAITAPLISLNQVARTVTSSHDFTLQAPVLTPDEVGDLATSMNELIVSVHDLLQRLGNKNQAIKKQKIKLETVIAELQSAQLQLIQHEKMSSLGQLVAGVAHEINNPVSFIYGNINHIHQYIEDLLALLTAYQTCYPKPLPEIQDCIQDIDLAFLLEDLPKVMKSMRMGTERIKQIVLSLRTFSRMDESELKTVDLHDGLESTLVILEHRFKANNKRPAIQITKNYSELPSVECYAGQINQVFMNILSNAIDALEDPQTQTPNAEITISTICQEHQAVINISDNGLGITDANKSKIFDPFFTTKAVGKGTGMGMAISYKIVVEKHHGQLLFESSLNHGTTFTVRLPLQLSNQQKSVA